MTAEVMTPEVEKLIREVIEHPTQEGGWKLTENPNDPDGGWTYAGVTSTVYNKHIQAHITYEDMQQDVVSLAGAVEENILQIYYNEFYLPAVAVVRNLLGEPGLELEGYELSCVVNVGLEHFEQIANEAHASSEASDKDNTHNGHFCYHWMMYYIRLVQKNAEAWRDWGKNCLHLPMATDMRAALHQMSDAQPKNLRAEFLAGWFNRVEHWRGTE